MGGLINSSMVKGDLWMIEAGGNMACYPLATTAEGPGPRVGHASLLVGNAFIVYGGDTKLEDTDILDETLYLLNTCKLLSLSSGDLSLNQYSNPTVVKSCTSWPTPRWPIWTFPKHPRFKDLRFWRPSRRILHE